MTTALGCLAAVLLTAPLAAQTSGNTQQVPFNHLFSATGQSMWGPGPATIFTNHELFRAGPPAWTLNPDPVGDIYTIPSSVSDADWLSIKPGGFIPNDAWLSLKPSIPGGFAGKKLGGQVTAFSKGHIQIVGVLNTADPGGVGVDYPIDVVIEFPEDNSFRDGEDVKIFTRYAPDTDGPNSPRLTMVSPTNVFDLNLEAGLGAWAEIKACFFDCWWFGLDEDDFDFDKDGDGEVSFEELLSDTFNPISSTQKKLFPAIDLPAGFSDGTSGPAVATVFQVTSQGELSFPVLDPLIGSLGLSDFEVMPHGFSQIETAGCGVPALAFINKACAWPGHGIRGIVDVPRVGIPCVSPFPVPWPRDPRGKDDSPFSPFTPNGWDWGCGATPVSTQLLASGVLKASTANTFAEVGLDLDHWFQLLTAGLPPECDPTTDSVKKCFAKTAAGMAFKLPLGYSFPFDDLSLAGIPTEGAVLSYDIVSLELPFRAEETREFEFTPDLEVDLVFPQEVRLWVTDPSDAIVIAPRDDTRVRFDVGNTLHITYPLGFRDPMQGKTEYSLPNTFTAEAGMNFDAGFHEQLLKASISIPAFDIWTSPTVDFCESFHLGEWAEDVINEVGSWFGEDEVDVPDSCPENITISAPAMNASMGPVVDEFQPLTLPSVSLMDETSWTLGGFSPTAGAPFTLDPEDPCIAIDTDLEPGILNGLGPAGTLVQTMTVENCGDVFIKTTQVTDVLTVAFPELAGYIVNSVTSADLTTNGTWNGSGATLTGSDVMAVGQTSTIAVEFQAAAGNIYNTIVAATGLSPIGTTVLDTRTGVDLPATDAGSFAVYAMDIDQDKLTGPGGKRAKVPVHVLDSEKLPIMQIDPESVLLDGVAPDNWEYAVREIEDEVIEGVTDIVLLFNQNDVWAKAQSRLATAALVESLMTRDEAITGREADALAAAILVNAEVSEELSAKADRLGNGKQQARAATDPRWLLRPPTPRASCYH
jgi:hypothetical protein